MSFDFLDFQVFLMLHRLVVFLNPTPEVLVIVEGDLQSRLHPVHAIQNSETIAKHGGRDQVCPSNRL